MDKQTMIMKMTATTFRNGPIPGIMVPNGIKPYDIAMNQDDDTAEVNMYGEIVSEIPTDFWTGERMEGLYIVLSDFLNDMEKLKEKSKVTFHINSPGGEVFAGVAIYNRMKDFKGTVCTVVDGLAASAASIIAQGASRGHRSVCTGSLTMIHGASSFMFGYYNSQEMKDSIKQVDAIDKAIGEIYSEMTGIDQDKIKNMMNKTTWMSAQEAVDIGFADEVINTEKVTMSLNASRKLLTVNGIPMSVRGLVNMPDYIPVEKDTVTAGEPDVINNQHTQGGTESMTYDELKQNEPELFNRIREEAIVSVQNNCQQEIDSAVKNEVERIKSIDEIANKIPDKELVNRAKYGDKKMSAGDLALEALKAQQDAGANFMQQITADCNNSGTADVKPEPNGNLPANEQDKNDIAAGAALIAGLK